MRIKFLPILFGVVFALTLLFAAAAGAQVQKTGSVLGGGGGIQVQEVQQQQVPDDQQQQLVEVQQQQVGTQAVQTQAQGCGDKRTVLDISRNNGDPIDNKKFDIDGDKFRVSYSVTFEDNNDPNNEFEVRIKEGSNTVKKNSTEKDVTNRTFDVNEGSGEFKLDTTRVDGVKKYSVKVEDCRGNNSNNNNNNNRNNNNNDTTTTTTGVSPAQTETTGITTTGTGETTTAADTLDSLAETTTADNANRSDNFQCESFLRAVRDDRGALKAQYSGNDLVVQRFEQCLSGDVLRNTIPNRNLPFTGGPSLLLGGGALLLVASALLARRMIRR